MCIDTTNKITKSGILILISGSLIFSLFLLMVSLYFKYDPLIYGIFTSILIIIIGLHIKSKNSIIDKKLFRILVLIFVGGLVLSFGYQQLNDSRILESSANQKYGYYDFSIDPTDYKISIDDINLYYDFSTNSGELSFLIDHRDLIGLRNLRIELPKELRIKNVILKSSQNILIKDVNYTIADILDNENETFVNIQNFNLSNDSSNVLFSMDLENKSFFSPNGRFILESNAHRVWDFDTTIKLNLGKYRCRNPCFANTMNAIIYEENFIVNVEMPENYYDTENDRRRLLIQEFSLNTENSEIKSGAEDRKNLGFGLIASGLVVLLQSAGEFIYYVFTRRRKKSD